MSEGTSEDENSISAGEKTDVLGLLEAHARHVATQLPRGQLGTQAAEGFLAAIPGAVRLRLADVTGTAAQLVELFVAHGLLPVLPNPKVSRAIPRLLAPLTPLVESRSARLWTLWLTALQDPRSPLVAKLRKATPVAALAVRPPAPTARVQTLRELSAERDALAARVSALQAEQVKLAAQHAERAEELERVAAQAVAGEQACAELRERLRLAEAARDAVENEAKSLAAKLAQLHEEHARQLAAVGAASPSELERVAEFYEAQLREAEARAAEAAHHTHAAAELADLQAFLRESLTGQEQLTRFALNRTRRS